MIKNVAVAGLGIVGTPIFEDLKDHYHVVPFDPPKRINNDISECGVVFICVTADTTDFGQDLSNIISVLKLVNKKAIVFIKSTVNPGTCDALAKEYGLEIYSFPEFLTERRARSDFHSLPMLVGGGDMVIKLFWPHHVVVRTSNTEAELAKMAHNVLGAVKVHICNVIYDTCKRLGLDYLNVRKGFLMSGLINAEHTLVPGHDGRRGFSGRCFPKDMRAFAHFLYNEDGQLLSDILARNEVFRQSI